MARRRCDRRRSLEQAWDNLLPCLASEKLRPEHLVKLVYITTVNTPEGLQLSREIRERKLGGVHGLLLAVHIGRGGLTAQHEAPVRALTEVAFEALKQWGGIHARRKSEVLAGGL